MRSLIRIFLILYGFLVVLNVEAQEKTTQNSIPANFPVEDNFLQWFRDYLEKIGNPAMLYHLKGREYVVHGNYPEAIRFLKMADSAFRRPIPEYELRTRPAGYWQAKQKGDIARAFRFWGFYDSAMIYHRKSLEELTRSGTPLPDVDVANQCEGIGLIYTFWGEYDSARHYFLLSKDMREYNSDWLGVGACYDCLGQISCLLGNYLEALKSLNDALAIKRRNRLQKSPQRIISYKESMSFTHLLLGKVYAQWGFAETAFREFNASLGLCREIGFISGETDALNEIGKLYMKIGQVDLASGEFDKAMKLCEKAGDKPGQAIVLKYRGDLCFKSGDYDKALVVYGQARMLAGKTGNPVEQAELDLRLGKTLMQLGRKEDSYSHLAEASAVAEKLKLQQTAIDAQILLSEWFEQQGRSADALILFKKVVSIRESQYRQKAGLIMADMDARHHADQNILHILLLTKDKQLKELKIKKFNNFMVLATCLILLVVLLLVLFFRNTRLKTDYRGALLRHRLFSSQLNPQVVYGGLNEILEYIKRSELDAAAKYLSYFSRFLQTTLYGSQKEFIPLEKEMLQINNYLDIQQLCHPGCFSYSIIPPGEFSPDELAIPPFLVQPFLEKAISSVLQNSLGNGRITVGFQLTGNILVATLDNTGIAVHESQTDNAPDEEATRKALSLTGERLAILWNKKRKTEFLRFSMIRDPGSGECINRIQMDIPVIRI